MFLRFYLVLIVLHCYNVHALGDPPGDCDDGYTKDPDTGECVKNCGCEPKGCNGDPHAHPGCGINCGRTCADYKDPPCDCDERIGCIEHGCDCDKGYVYDGNIKKCVKPCDCTPVCGVNETYSLNPTICPPDTCDAIGEAFACPAETTSDKPACVCKDGYYRNKDNDCVPKEDCDSCGGDPYARPGCGNPCGRTCADRDGCESECSKECPGGCDCLEGYWLNTDTGKCVRPCDCP